jgi:hypothetical protein
MLLQVFLITGVVEAVVLPTVLVPEEMVELEAVVVVPLVQHQEVLA